MLVAGPLAGFVLIFVRVQAWEPDLDWRKTFLRATVWWGAFATLSLEFLSLLSLVTPVGIALAWTFLIAALLVSLGRRGAVRKLHFPELGVPNPKAGYLALVVGCGLMALATALVAWASPPNTWDSLNYHMPKVAQWAQQAAVRHFATGIEWQNSNNPGAEMFILHLYVLSGGDQLVNFVAWFSFVGIMIGASVIAAQLGAGRLGQAAAALVVSTIPMAITQASSTMTDLPASLFLVGAASEVVHMLQDRPTLSRVAHASGAAGLAVLVKATAVPYLLPLAAIALAALRPWKSLGRTALSAGIAAAIVLTLNAGHLLRNLDLYQSPLGMPEFASGHMVSGIDWKTSASNILKNASFHAGTPWAGANDFIYRAIIKIHLLMGLRPNDPRTTSIGTWRIEPPTTEEDKVSNPAHAYLFALTLIAGLIVWSRLPRHFLVYSLCVAAGFVLFAILVKWQVFVGRLHLPFFVLFAPVVALTLERISSRASWLTPVVLLALSYPWALSVNNRPLVPLQNWSQDGASSILVTPRPIAMLGNGSAYRDMDLMVDAIRAAGCPRVGLMLGGASREYAVWSLLGAPDPDLELHWIVGGTYSARLSRKDFSPCAVVCEYCPEGWATIRGVPLVYNSPPYRLFLLREP